MKKILFLILLLVSSLVFVTLKDNNNFKEGYTQQETTQDTEQFYPVEESVWDPGPNIDPDAQSTESGNDSGSIKSEEENKKLKLSIGKGNIFKNTPKSVVTDVYKAMINNDFEL